MDWFLYDNSLRHERVNGFKERSVNLNLEELELRNKNQTVYKYTLLFISNTFIGNTRLK